MRPFLAGIPIYQICSRLTKVGHRVMQTTDQIEMANIGKAIGKIPRLGCRVAVDSICSNQKDALASWKRGHITNLD